IQGVDNREREYSPRFLLQRLITHIIQVPDPATHLYKLDLHMALPRSYGNDSDLLWRLFGNNLSIRLPRQITDQDRDKIARRIAELLRIGHVVLVIQRIEELPNLEACIGGFWSELTRRVTSRRHGDRQHCLFLFILHYLSSADDRSKQAELIRLRESFHRFEQ